MITQILVIVASYTMIYFLLRLHHFILACGKDKQKYHRAYFIGFDETDWDSDQDGDSTNESDSKGATKAQATDSLAEWPMELDLQIEAPAYARSVAAEKGKKYAQ